MRYAIFSDVHGNLDALEAVLDAIRGESVDCCACLGDVVGYGPQPRECLAAVRRHCTSIVAGNHDFAVADKLSDATFNALAREATAWTRKALPESDIAYLASLPLVGSVDGGGLVHGTPYAPELFDYVQTSYDAHLAMSRMDSAVCFIGHSHIPVNFVQAEIISYSLDPEVLVPREGRLIVNVGSVGQPRDRDPRACFVIYDSSEGRVSRKRVSYDIERVATKIREAGLPEALGARLRLGR